MSKEVLSLQDRMKEVGQKFLEESKNLPVYVVSHFDTDGITSAAIISKCLKNLDRNFSVKIVKSLEKEFFQTLPKDRIVMFLDLSSGSMDYIKNAGLKKVFVIDHHELSKDIPEGIEIVNPHMHNNEKISSAGLVYMFCKEIDEKSKSSAKLAVLGMIGDLMEREIEKIIPEAVLDGEVNKKRGLLIYPSTRPINRALEYSSNPYIPGVTGSQEGVRQILREAGIEPTGGQYKTLLETTDEEMRRLVTAVMIRSPKSGDEIIGDIFLIKMFNKSEDAREVSAMINACSRLGESGTALRFCLEIPKARKEAEEIYIRYKQHIISGLEVAAKTEKIVGKGFVILNAQDKIKDTIIGTITSILSNSSVYEKGTIMVSMAYYEDKIKVSARGVGRSGRNVHEVLDRVVKEVGGEVGGHEFAAGCIIEKKNESIFIETLRNHLEIEMVKV